MRRRLQAFVHAWRGVRVLVRTQPNARIHLTATTLVVAAGLLLGVSRVDWLWLIAAVAAVWTAEALNTAIELLGDEISLEQRTRIGHAKDLGAAAVLCASLGAAVIGVLVFAPYVAGLSPAP